MAARSGGAGWQRQPGPAGRRRWHHRLVGSGTIDVKIRREPLSSPVAQPLVAAFEREVAALYPQWTPIVGPSAHADELEAPTGGFFVAYTGAEAVACGGFKRLTDRIAEVKRIYTARDMRGRGLGAMILARIESEAAAAGYELIRLDTGERQPHAIALYRSAGYYEIPDYNGNPPASHWFEKVLPRDNVEIVRRVYEAWARDDFPGPSELIDPTIEYVNPTGAVESGIRRGVEAFTAAIEKVFEAWESWRMEPERLTAAGDQVAVAVRYQARGRATGIEVTGRESALWTIRDGKVVRYEWFHEPADAFEAAGLGE